MADKKVVTKGGGKNLYKVGESGGTYYVSQVDAGFLSNSFTSLGKTRSMKDALDIIRSVSGKEIESMSDW